MKPAGSTHSHSGAAPREQREVRPLPDAAQHVHRPQHVHSPQPLSTPHSPQPAPALDDSSEAGIGTRSMAILLREAIGDQLRSTRTDQRRTLREVSSRARVSLGYLSEVERGQKEASSELLAAICDALDLPISHLLTEVAGHLDTSASPEGLPAGAPMDAEVEDTLTSSFTQTVAPSGMDERIVGKQVLVG